MASLLDLPNELLVLIANHLAPAERARLRAACRRLRAIVDGSTVDWLRVSGLQLDVGADPVHVNIRANFIKLLADEWYHHLASFYGLVAVDGAMTADALIAGAQTHPGLFSATLASVPTDIYRRQQTAVSIAARLHATGRSIEDWTTLGAVVGRTRAWSTADLDTCIDYVRLSSMHGARSLAGMRMAVNAIRTGVVPLVCPPNVHDCTDIKWSTSMHHLYVRHLNIGGADMEFSAFVEYHRSNIDEVDQQMLALRRRKPNSYITQLCQNDLWHMPFKGMSQAVGQRCLFMTQIESGTTNQISFTRREGYVSIGTAIEDLLRDGPSERLRDEWNAARSSSAFQKIERVYDVFQRTQVLRNTLAWVYARPNLFSHHSVALAIDDACMLLGVFVTRDEYRALAEVVDRKRRRSPEPDERRVRARTADA